MLSGPPRSPALTRGSMLETPLASTVVASGLVEGLALLRAAAHVASLRPTSVEDHDRRLGERLVEAGALNEWQLDQLRRGRTKFRLGPYLVFDSIARGGMGHVFKARHELLGRVEAVKVLPLSKGSPAAIASFLHEMRAQAALDHPNLVRVSYADRDGEVYYLVTEYVPGIDLRRLVRRRGPLSESVAAWVVAQAAAAVDHAHRRGFVHRDVKPGNLLLTPTGGVKLTDLGLAWSLDGDTDTAAAYAPGKVAGTSDYIAPEAIRFPDRVRPESDLYSLGCTLYYAVTGKVPYPGGTHAEKLRRRLRDDPPDPLALAPGLSTAMVACLRSAMARPIEHRPASAAEMAATLRELCSDADRDRLAVAVTETIARRTAAHDTKHRWDSDDGGELPETVGLPLHEVLPPNPDFGPRPASPNEPRERGAASVAGSWWRTPQVITWGALGATAILLALAALGSLLGG